MREQNQTIAMTHSMPSRRERLRVLMKLKSQRQLLLGGMAGLAAMTIALSAAVWHERSSPDLVRLGSGVASVNEKAVTTYASLSLVDDDQADQPEPRPSASESSLGAGAASFYGSELAGNRTASGEPFNPDKLTAAHRTLPMGSRVRVTNSRNGESVIVRINDRGPFHKSRVIDLSTAAAKTIGLIGSGTGQVRLALLIG